MLTAALYLGTRIVIFVPAPTPVSIVRPWPVPNVARSRSSTLRSPTDSAGPAAGQDLVQLLRVRARPVILDGDDRLVPGVRGDDLQQAAPGPAFEPVPDGVLHQRLEHQRRQPHGQRLGRDPQDHREPVAEARAFQFQVGLHQAQFLGQRHVLAVLAETAPGELGET